MKQALILILSLAIVNQIHSQAKPAAIKAKPATVKPFTPAKTNTPVTATIEKKADTIPITPKTVIPNITLDAKYISMTEEEAIAELNLLYPNTIIAKVDNIQYLL